MPPEQAETKMTSVKHLCERTACMLNMIQWENLWSRGHPLEAEVVQKTC